MVGYGSTLRSDDGVGWHVADRLADDPRLAGAEVLARHQLTPELAADVARAALVVLVDAALGGEPGSIVLRRVPPPRPRVPGRAGRSALRGRPAGRPGRGGASSLAPGGNLSPTLERVVPEVMQVVVRVAGR